MSNKKRRTPANFLGVITSINERIEERIPTEPGRSSLSTRLHREAQIIERAVGALNKVEANYNPAITEAAHLKKVANMASVLKRKVSESRVRIKSTQQELFTQLDKNITDTINLKENGYAGEVRSSLRVMTEKNRNTAIQSLINSGDSESLAASLNAPAVLTGLTPDLQDKYRMSYEESHAPHLVKQRADALKTIGDLDAVCNTAVSAADNLVDDERMEEIDRDIAASDEAHTQFTESFNVGN